MDRVSDEWIADSLGRFGGGGGWSEWRRDCRKALLELQERRAADAKKEADGPEMQRTDDLIVLDGQVEALANRLFALEFKVEDLLEAHTPSPQADEPRLPRWAQRIEEMDAALYFGDGVHPEKWCCSRGQRISYADTPTAAIAAAWKAHKEAKDADVME